MNYTILLSSFFVSLSLHAQLPSVSAGTLKRIENFQSKWVTARTIDVWLPEGYSAKNKYAVLYMHDGQMLYDATITWNKSAWDVDDVVTKLLNEKRIKNVLVVGVSNSGPGRHADYFPQKPFEELTQLQRDTITAKLQKMGRSKEVFKPVSDNYLRFLVTELKPFIDENYATKTTPENTFVAGSSMGGLISLYAICEYPNVFGGAACLSTHWPGVFSMDDNPVPTAFLSYLKNHLPNPKNHKIYFDYGDQTLDALYPPLQKKVDEVMIVKGFSEKNWNTTFFAGHDHSEKSWGKRLDVPLLFLLKK